LLILIDSQYQSGLAIGIFSGVVLVMSSQMLIVFALFVDRIQNGHNGNNEPVERAMAVLTFFLFVAYGLFAVLLVVFRKDIVKEHGE
jgi:Na+/proline symporter